MTAGLPREREPRRPWDGLEKITWWDLLDLTVPVIQGIIVLMVLVMWLSIVSSIRCR